MSDKIVETYGQKLRRRLLGAGEGESDVTVTFGGESYLLVPPKVKQRQSIMEAAITVDFDPNTGKPGKVKSDQAELQVQALIACCRDPKSRMPVFTMADREAMLDGTLTAFFDSLSGAALKLVRPEIEEAKKNSSETPISSSSTPSAPSSTAPSPS